MIASCVISFLLLAVGIVLVLKITPQMVIEDLKKVFVRKHSYTSSKAEALGKHKVSRVGLEIKRLKAALETMGKENAFSWIITASIIMLFVGCVIALVLSNVFLMPVLSVVLAVLPFLYAKKTVSNYDKQMKEELETALSVITTSYIRNDDILLAVRENLQYLKAPVKNVFENFYLECTSVSADTVSAIRRMKLGIKDRIFEEWCDTLILCQNDRTLNDTLMPIVAKYTDVRIVNNELKTMMGKARAEYFVMAALVLGNVPLLKLINDDWYRVLVETIPGKLVLAVSALVIVVTAGLMADYTKPVEFTR